MPEEAAGERLDRHVALHLDAPRNQVQHWITDGLVRVAGRPAKASRPVAAGEAVECEVPVPVDHRITPEAGDLAVLFEDEHLLVVDKPAGLTVHPGAGRSTGTLVHRLVHRYPELAGVGGTGRPGIVHRLDKDTSGVMVVARSAQAYRALARAFAARDVDKQYLAVVYGLPGETGRVDAPIGRHPQHRVRMAVRPEGRPAVSTWRRLATGPGVALLEVSIETGRTHQIRVHLKSASHPLVGDPLYGAHRWKELPGRRQALLRDFPRPALHAWRLAFPHPVSGERVAVTAPVPEDVRRLWEGLSEAPWPVDDGAWPGPAADPIGPEAG